MNACVDDIHEFAGALRGAERTGADSGATVWSVRGKTFLFFRTPRPDALDPETGERLTDVIVFWVRDLADKAALVNDDSTPFFTTPHFDGHPSVLLRAAHVAQVEREELREVIEDACLARAPVRMAKQWLAERG